MTEVRGQRTEGEKLRRWEGEKKSAIRSCNTFCLLPLTFKFKVSGLGAGGYGVDKLSATGEVYRLKDIADFPGKYSELRGGITLGKGVGGFYIRNDKGVVIELKTHAEGVALSVGVQGLTIQMVDEK